MQQLVDPDQVKNEKKLSPAIYAALVDSLFQNPLPMLAGAICVGAAAVMTAWKTGVVWLWPCAVVIVAIGTVRTLHMWYHVRRRGSTTRSPSAAARWEISYQLGALLYMLAMGVWCAVVLLFSDDAVSHLICCYVTIAYTAAGVGRTYGRPWIFHLQILLAMGPQTLALMRGGDPYYIGLALFNVLFFVGLRQISLSLQEMFVRALFAKERESALAGQFDTALNNMPHGLCMFDGDGRLAVVNNRFLEMMGLEAGTLLRGRTIHEIIDSCVAAKAILPLSGASIVAEMGRAKEAEVTTLDSGPLGSRAMSWTFQPMEGGGTVVLIEDITDRRNAQMRISQMAQFDQLTGLPNRVYFRDEIDRLLGEQRKPGHLSALLFIDLDQFKQVNDTLGHPCGDQLLCAVAVRLRELLAASDVVARFGGDEFVVFQSDVASLDQTSDLARRIVERLSERYEIDNHSVEIGASIGISVTSQHDASADTLLKNADMALYRAKADGRGTWCFFRDEMAKTVEMRRTLELDLRTALANEAFEIYYQPLVNLATGKITTCEALLRWNHPERGPVSPADIIPVAEDMGLIIDLGRWIMRKACMECMKWPEQVSVAVNLSPLQFRQRDVTEDIRYALEVSGLPAHRLEIEITEGALLHNTQSNHDALQQIRALGVRISLDDFGTGYSSLSYLHNFPLQKVKIDRSFLENIDDDKPLMLLRGVARLSADLGMAVVVEGVETYEQLNLIAADNTVTEAQGYLFSRPVPSVQVRKLLNASHGQTAHRDDNVVQIWRSIAR
jgi:diguanylate cyclase (GGDEF)-like protein